MTLGNNHALDFGSAALLDTFAYLRAAGIPCVGAGRNRDDARAPAILERKGIRLGVIGCSDHPATSRPGRPTQASPSRLRAGLDWLPADIEALDVDVVLVTAHWGPNMSPEPLPYVRRAAAALRDAGATLIAGHSAHLFHGVQPGILYGLGDFVDDYAVDRERNDLGALASRISLSRRRSLRFARRTAAPMNGATIRENPAGSPRLRSDIVVPPPGASDHS
jgi:poly-gamma-glutamate capsule biosynthesis protein CapA/YwtB (metallophosphatase superfamily)